jgi:Ni,Fe-hydrogenase III small subunit
MAFKLNSITAPHMDDKVQVAGRPVITGIPIDQFAIKAVCPSHAIAVNPVRIDLAKCTFCRACSEAFPEKVKFISDYQLASNVRDRLVVLEGEDSAVLVETDLLRNDVRQFEAPVIKLKLVTDVVTAFPLAKYHYEHGDIVFVDTAREAHGIIIATGSMNIEMIVREYNCLIAPKIVALAGREALMSYDTMIAAGDWPTHLKVDMFIPGDPVHPTVFINGILALTKSKN